MKPNHNPKCKDGALTMAVVVGPVDVVDEGAPERAPAAVAAACSGSGDHLGRHRRIHHCHR
jgi:hypothetical protein